MGEGGAVLEQHIPEENGNADEEKSSKVDVDSDALMGTKGKDVDSNALMGTKGEDVDNDALMGTEGEDGKSFQEMEEDNVHNMESEIHVEKSVDEHKEIDEIVEGEKFIEEEKEVKEAAGKDTDDKGTKSEEMEEDTEENTHNISETKVEDGIEDVDEDTRSTEEPSTGKGSKTRGRSKGSPGEKDISNDCEPEEKTKKKTPLNKTGRKALKDKKEPKTPAASTIERPVRQRKSVERLVNTILKDSGKDFRIKKGRGTALKDIPNVAYKLSRKKTDDTFKLLHTILFGRRGKAAEVKNNISRFSGFVWHDNEEKQITKLKEKLDKCIKEKLVELCDVLDITVSKATTRKEDIISKLVEFLVAPHAKTSELLAEKEQSSKSKKRKRASKSTADSDDKASKDLAKGPSKRKCASKKGEKKSTMPDSEDESEEEDANDLPERSGDEMSESEEKETETEKQKDVDEQEQKHGSVKSSAKKGSSQKGIAATKNKSTLKTARAPRKSGDEMSELAESEEKEIETEEPSDDDKGKQKHVSEKSAVRKESAEKAASNKKARSKTTSPPPKKGAAKSPLSRMKNTRDTDTGKKSTGKNNEKSTAIKSSGKKGESTPAKKSSRKKKDDSTTELEHSGVKTRKAPVPRRLASKESTGDKKDKKSDPDDNELRNGIVEILKGVDFNKATFTDILKMLDKKFATDFTPRKSAIKIMIKDELTKLADATEESNKEVGENTRNNQNRASAKDLKF
ncbi:DEK domain-containing chromatin-associated protein 3-like [Andrographis paniculata]|uniref:DEK domain-containing chromatin-associated protein 3-like n=1 Tax=Andrographis paniculata TaxID=175694 RepID=UPI0021E9996D|nr:DEK domain-containing chromatin-associated protein 3-like [Andrographis paniculata]XP_051125317.1 DEK domain-containing chromatin-associated protein 3-like [Andrographis paniculata]